MSIIRIYGLFLMVVQTSVLLQTQQGHQLLGINLHVKHTRQAQAALQQEHTP